MMSPYHALTPVASPLAYQNESVGARPSTASHQRCCCCCTIFKLPDYTAAAASQLPHPYHSNPSLPLPHTTKPYGGTYVRYFENGWSFFYITSILLKTFAILNLPICELLSKWPILFNNITNICTVLLKWPILFNNITNILLNLPICTVLSK